MKLAVDEVAEVLGAAQVLRDDGQKVALAEAWREKTAIVVFLRHFACLFCREQITRLHQHQAEIAAAGAQLVAVGNGTPNFIQGFREHVKFDGPVYTDPDKAVYAALHLRHGGTISLRSGLYALRATFRGYLTGCPQGDTAQQGGVFIMRPDGRCTYAYASRVAGDHPGEREVLAALRAR